MILLSILSRVHESKRRNCRISNNESRISKWKFNLFWNFDIRYCCYPTNAEWDTLENYLIANGYNWDGTKTGNNNKVAKSLTANMDWSLSTKDGAIGNNLTTNNKSGFSAFPGGYRGYSGDSGTKIAAAADGAQQRTVVHQTHDTVTSVPTTTTFTNSPTMSV